MISKKDHSRLRNLLVDAISLLCRNGVPFRSVLRVDALVGITLDKNEVVLININEDFPKGSDSDLETVETVDDGYQSLAGNQNVPLHATKQTVSLCPEQNGDKEETKTNLEPAKCPTIGRICIASDLTTNMSGSCDIVNKTADMSYDMQIDSGCEQELKPMLATESKASYVADDSSEPCLFIKNEQPCSTDSSEQQNLMSGLMSNASNLGPSDAVSSVLLSYSQPCHVSDWPVGINSGERSPGTMGKDYALSRHLKVTAYEMFIHHFCVPLMSFHL